MSPNKPIVVTHSDAFHPDDVMAIAIMSLYLKKPIHIIRSRKPKDWAKADYIFDVGGEFNPKKHKFDHHQASFKLKRKNGVVYSSAGLAWKYYGMKIAGSEEVWKIIDYKIIQPLDAEDNGIEIYKEVIQHVKPFSFFDYIYAFNPTRIEKNVSSLSAFKKAAKECAKMLKREVERIKGSISSDKKVVEIYKKTKDKRIIVFNEDYSWKHVLDKYKEPLFVVSPRPNGAWGLKALRKPGSKFKNRMDMPKSWAAKTGKDLAKITGVPDAIFCHRNLFVAGAKSKEGALALAQLALKGNKH